MVMTSLIIATNTQNKDGGICPTMRFLWMQESSWLWTKCGVNLTKYTNWVFHRQWWLCHMSMNNCRLIRRQFDGFLGFQLELPRQNKEAILACAWRKQMRGGEFIQSGCCILTTASTTKMAKPDRCISNQIMIISWRFYNLSLNVIRSMKAKVTHFLWQKKEIIY